jgi:plastocyanin
MEEQEGEQERPGVFTIGVILAIALLIPTLVAFTLVFGFQSPAPKPGGSGIAISIPDGVGSNQSLNFSPAKVTVVVGINNTIRWVQNDPIPHTVTSLSVPNGAAFDSKNLNKGDTFSLTLTVPGTYTYDCSYHPGWMKGTIVVLAQGGQQSLTSSSAQGKVVQVAMPNGVGANPGLNFNPAKVTVVIGVNNTVQWIDQDSGIHTVTSTSVPAGAKAFDSGDMSKGGVFSFTFTVPGTYNYYCKYHAWMQGTVVVKQGG